MSIFKPILKTKSIPAKIFFVLSLVFAGPVSFLLYDFYINWSANSSKTIVWYLAFAYDTMGAWGGVALALAASFLCYFIGMNIHRTKQRYYWK